MMDCRARLARLAGVMGAALLGAVILFIQPQGANAFIGNVIPMNEFEEPTDSFTTANALLAAVTVDPFGGRVCVVPESTTNPGDGSLSCDDAASWASPNFVSGIGTQFVPIKGPSLKIGTWKLLGDSSQGAPDALSIPFTVSPCLDCDTTIAESIVNQWKDAAQQARGGISGVCTATALYSLFNSAVKGNKLIRLVREDAPVHQFVALAVGTALGFSITAPFSELTFIKKGTGMIQDLSCAVRMMYDDIIADPSDPNFDEVVVPRPFVTSASGDPLIDSLSQEFSDVAAFAEAQRISFERYFGAVEASNLEASALQAGAIAEFGAPLVESMRDLADGLRTFGDQADADPNENDPVTTEAQLQDTIAIYQRVRQNGFTSEELQQLQDGGLSAAEIAVVDQAFDLDIETTPVNTSYTAILHDAADHLDQAANAFNEVSLHAGAVAATIRAMSEANQPPVANRDTLTTVQDAPGSVNVLANDTDPDGDTLAVTTSTNGGHGTVTCGPAGDCTYTPAAGYTGEDSFTYTISDGHGGSATANVSVFVFEPARPIALVPISTNFNGPIGIDYHQPTNKVAVSVNYPSGFPLNFELIAQDGSHAPFSSISGFTDEVKIGTVRGSSCQGGFQAGELFTGTGVPGVIARIAPDGSSVANPWVTLPDELGLMRGSLFQDRYCSFGGDLIAVTTFGGVWRVTAAGAATKTAQIGSHLEGLTTVPNDPARYGPWAGKLLAGAELQSRIYAIAADGTVTPYELGIAPEDIDIVPAKENFFGVDFAAAEIKGAPASEFADKVGDVVIAQEFPGILWDVHWNAAVGAFEVSEIARVGQWEHVTFAPAGINPLPPANSAPVASDGTVTTEQGTPVEITLQASDPDGDALTYSIVSEPSHGSLSGASATRTYTPDAGYTGPDSFTFKASDGSLDSNVAMVSITVAAVKRSTSTTYTGGTSVQYSDPVTLSGTLLDTTVNPSIGIAGKQLDFTLGTQSKSAGPTAADGSASTLLVVTQQPGSVASIETAFAGDASYLASSDSDPFTIAKEDCTLGYSGDVDVAPTAMTTLAADLGEPDATRGDRSNKTVVFTVTGVVNVTPQVYTATTDTDGHASVLVPLGSDVYAVRVSFSGDAFYKSCATTQDAVVTVEAAAAKVTGGGWTSISTGRTNFGFNAIPEAGGLWKGQFQLRANNNKSKFHARSVSTLSSSGNSATWTGTGTWNGQTNYAYTISVVDNGSSGSKKGDKISITITSPAGVIVYSTGGFQTLKGGNVTVH